MKIQRKREAEEDPDLDSDSDSEKTGSLETTLCIIKPDAKKYTKEILGKLRKEGMLTLITHHVIYHNSTSSFTWMCRLSTLILNWTGENNLTHIFISV